MKYIIKYTDKHTNEITYIEVDSMLEFAFKYMDFDLIQNERGGWDVLLLGKEAAHYTNEWTRAEVLKDYFKDFERKNNYKNIEYYTKI